MMMSELTEMQAAALSTACGHADGTIVLPARLRGVAVRTFGAGLIAKGWACEIPVDTASAKPWRTGEDGTGYGLMLTQAGRDIVGRQRETERADEAPVAQAERPATKLSLLLEQMSCTDGAALATLTAATSWLPHTVRAALVRLRQKGHAIERERGADGVSRYRLVGSAATTATESATAASDV
jgi:hypothetical protein